MTLKYIPNILSIFRILVAPFFIITFLSPLFSIRMFSLFLFFAGSLSDFLDGFIARKYNIVTNFGKIVDPIADKVLIVSAFVLLNYYYPYYVRTWMVACIIARDVGVTIFRIILQRKGFILHANMFAKRKTLFQIIIIHILLIIHAVNSSNEFASANNNLIYILMIICTLVTVLSGFHYLITNYNNAKSN